jgi:hypothetical protein
MRNQPPMISLAMVFILDRCAGDTGNESRTGDMAVGRGGDAGAGDLPGRTTGWGVIGRSKKDAAK